ncbi:sugar transferase [Porcipelethomonas sp.]|uniref:sugar transferase n=1 Tax=Porcipelethomonas sp. TaxID=2981675 RepID=UPI003EF1761A
MKNKEQYKRTISFISSLILLVALAGIFIYIWYEYYSDVIVLPFYRRGNWVVIFIYMILTMLFFKAYGGLKMGYLKRSDMLYSQAISIVAVNIITYLQISVIGRQLMNVYPMFVMTAADFIIIAIWIAANNKIYLKLYPPRKLIIIYGSRNAETLTNKMSMREDKYMICESINIHENIDKIKKEILRFEGVIICDISGQIRNDIIKYCFDNSKRIYISPKISDIIIRGGEDIRLFDTPLLLCRNDGLSFEQKIIKRVFDVAVSAVGLILLSPVMLLIAIAIKLDDGGKILYKQKRLTIDAKEFYVYKFRSMIPDAEKDGVPRLATDSDSRITRVGRFLRKCRLDELPQLINILRGDMSVVGPRPERPELTEKYEREMPEFKYRLKVKAGLTGYAQVTGVYDTTPYDKLKMDLMYIERYSLVMDLRIILMTIKTMIFPGEMNSKANKEKEKY